MIFNKSITIKPDTFGAIASILCMIHCLATPLLFIAHACSVKDGCATAPIWWRSLDFLFLAISFMAIYRSTKTTSKKIMKSLLWINWAILCFFIINEQFQWTTLPKMMMHIAAFSLAGLHLYNLKYCQCKKDKCCVNNQSNQNKQ